MGMVNSIYAAIFGGSDGDVVDPATGLTLKEKEAIRSSWALLANKKALRTNGVEFFVMLFTEYPEMQNFFSAFKGMSAAALRKDRTMYSHSLTVMYSFASLVDNLDDADQLALLVQKIAHNHVARDVGFKYFEQLAEMFPKFLDARAGSNATPFIKQSWSKLLGVMNSLVKAEEERQKST